MASTSRLSTPLFMATTRRMLLRCQYEVIMKMMLLLFLENVFYPVAVRHNKPGSPSSITAW